LSGPLRDTFGGCQSVHAHRQPTCGKLARVPSERSYEDKRPGQQLYGVIEFCASPEVLYAKIESGHYDWLGVRQGKRGRVNYVLGRPRLARQEGLASGTAKHGPPSMTGQHRVEVHLPHRLRPPPSSRGG
jgi:hypothetical protein